MAAFEPEDSTGTDGLPHLEMAPLACSCGFQATCADELDRHFLAAFTPAGLVGRDGRKHQLITPAASDLK